MKITLVNPEGEKKSQKQLHLSLLYLATALHRKGHTVKVVDSQIENIGKKLRPLILKSDIVGFSVMTNQVKNAIELSDLVKEKDPDIKVVWGGIHPTLYPKQTVEDKSVDFVITNEGEITLLELSSWLEGKGKISDIKGLVYKENGKVRVTSKREFLDLNTLSPPEWEILKIREYISDFKIGGKSFGKSLPLHSGRGCVYNCAFCINLLENRWRPLNAGKILGEVKILTERYGIEYIQFMDENFFVNKKRVEEFCEAMISENIDVKWHANTRANYFNENHLNNSLMRLAKKSGCTTLAMGIESGSEKILNKLKKEITMPQILNAVTTCRKFDINTICSFMIGIPGEEKKDMMETLRLITKIKKINPKAYIIGPQVFRPYPGCSLYNEVKGLFKEPLTLREWSSKNLFEGYASLDSLPWISEPDIAANAWFYVMRAQSTPDSFTKALLEFPFKKIADFRMKHGLFGFNIDKEIFESFQGLYHKQFQSSIH